MCARDTEIVREKPEDAGTQRKRRAGLEGRGSAPTPVIMQTGKLKVSSSLPSEDSVNSVCDGVTSMIS